MNPNTIRKTWRRCFANEEAFTNFVKEIFFLIDEAYKSLIDKEKRRSYNESLKARSRSTYKYY